MSKIATIQINNFRSIEDLYLEPENLSAIVGPNSAGKTNVLKAIDLVLGEGWTTKAKIARELFRDPTQPIQIATTFTSPIVIPGNTGYSSTNVSSIELKMTLNPELSATTTFNNGDKSYGLEKFKKICHFIYLPSERDLRNELRVSNWTMLGKMMKLVYENYIHNYDDDEEKLKEDFKKEISSAKAFLEEDFDEESVTFKKFSDTFKKYCKTNSAGLANSFEPSLDIYNLNWFYKTLQIHVKEDLPNKVFDSQEVGAGMKNLLMISIMQTYSELMGGKVIFGIEEPEIYLYPQAQRSLYKSFQEISASSQILYTTHNPNFIDASRAYEVYPLRKTLKKRYLSFRK